MSSNSKRGGDSRSQTSDPIKQLVINEQRGRKSQKRNEEKKEERKHNFIAKRQQEEEEDNSYLLKYRDRAKELRELGYDKDYEGLLPENFKDLTEEEMQLLGGDMTRSHLVKGLDMILLEKRRQEIAEEEKKKKLSEEMMNQMKMNVRCFNSVMASNIYSTLFESKKRLENVNEINDTREFFLKGKNSYSLQLEGDSDSLLFSSPTMTVRSRRDCPSFSIDVMYQPSENILEMITQSMSNAGFAKKKTRKRKDRKEIKAVDADLDMFSD